MVTHACYSRVVRDALRTALPGVEFLVLAAPAPLLRQRKVARFEAEARRSGVTLQQYVMEHPHLEGGGATRRRR